MTRWFERVALGAIMGMVAFVVERRLIKVLRRRSQDESRSGTEEDVELTVTPEQVEE
jgi:hypothetical protein